MRGPTAAAGAAMILGLSAFAIAQGTPGGESGALAAARAAREAGRMADARRGYEAILSAHAERERPAAAAALLELGALAEAEGELREAEERYRQVARWFPERRGDINAAEARLEAARDGGLYLEALLARAARARGQARLDALRSARLRGEFEIAGARLAYTRILTGAPLRIREDVSDKGLSKAWDGERGWLIKGEESSELKGPTLDRTVAWGYESWAALTGRREGTRRYLGETRVQGRLARRIEVRDGADVWIEDIDDETALPARAEGRQLDGAGKVRILTLYTSGWLRVDGAAFPGRTEVYDGDELVYAITISEVELDPALSPADFQPAR